MNESIYNVSTTEMNTTESVVSCGTGDHTTDYNQPLRIGSIFIILTVSALGTMIPFITQKYVKNTHVLDMFHKLGVAFGTGVVLATAFIHMLPPAQSAFANPCIADYITLAPEYPWCYLIAMMAVVVLHLIDFVVRCSLQGQSVKEEEEGKSTQESANEPVEMQKKQNESHKDDCQECDDPTPTIRALPNDDGETIKGSNDVVTPELPVLNVHTHHQNTEAPHDCCDVQLQIEDLMAKAATPAMKISFLILEVGISMHSILIGLTLGLTAEEFDTLLIALCFHQFFEGIGLGSACVSSNINQLSARVGTLLWFSLSTPLGVAIGIGIHESIGSDQGDTPQSVIASGVMDAVSFGILLYVAMIELMTKQISMNEELMSSSVWKRAATFVSMYLGMLAMVIIGAYA